MTYALCALLFLTPFVALGQASPPPTLQLSVAVDGSKDPDLIPDDVAYRHFLLSVAEHAAPTARESKRQEAKLKALGLAKADHDNLLQQVNGLPEQLDAVSSGEEKRALLDSAVVSLKLSGPGWVALDRYVQTHVKPHTIILAAPHPGHLASAPYRIVPAILHRQQGRLQRVQGSQMNYNVSVYNNASTDGTNLYGTSTTDDESSGCSHGNYMTTSTMTTPGGNGTSQSSGGLASNVQLPLDNFGTYWVYGSVQFYCSCIHGTAGGGGGGYGYTPDINTLIQQYGLSDLITSVQDNGDGTYALHMGIDDFRRSMQRPKRSKNAAARMYG